jgi:Ca2+-binding RTX toxin-like protein
MNDAASNAGAAYVFVRNGTTWTQEAYLKASNTEAGDQFGVSVAVSGAMIVVGANLEDSNAAGINGDGMSNAADGAGATYVFARNGATWQQQAYLKASNPDANDFFGFTVAVSNNTVIVGAYGEDSNAGGVNGEQLNNDVTDAGAAYVFVHNGTTWQQQAYLKASSPDRYNTFGWAVALSDDTVVVTAMRDTAAGDNNDGAAYVFVRSGIVWTLQGYLKASNTEFDDRFGYAVAISGDIVVVGAYEEDSAATGVNGDERSNTADNAGAAYVFVRNNTNWMPQSYLKASNTEASDRFGKSVTLMDGIVVVGAPWEGRAATGVNGDESNNAARLSGAAYIFVPSEAVGLLIGSCGGYDVYKNKGAYRASGWNGTIQVGTNGNDALNGTNEPDLLLGLGGNDLLRGGAGDDLLCGGDGVDLLQGFAGNDYLDGGPGNDVLNGGSGDYDQLKGGDGNDILLDGDGVSNATGGAGNDTFTLFLRNGWRDHTDQTRFTGLHAGYDNDLVMLAILNPVRFFVDITGDERDDPPSALEGNKDTLTLAGAIDPSSVITKFEKQWIVAAESAQPIPDDEAGVAYLTESVGAEAVDSAHANRIFLPLIR